MTQNFCRAFLAGLILALPVGRLLEAEEAKPLAPEDWIPRDALVALACPDLNSFRAQAAQSRLGKMIADPEMQAFLQPVLANLTKGFQAVLSRNPLLPRLEDLEAGLLSGEVAGAVYPRPAGENPPVGVVFSLATKGDAASKALEALLTKAFQGQLPPLGAVIPIGQLGAVRLTGRLLVSLPGADLGGFMKRFQEPPAGAVGLRTVPAFQKSRAKLKASEGWLFLQSHPLRSALQGLGGADAQLNQLLNYIFRQGAGQDEAAMGGLGFQQGELIFEGCSLLGSGSQAEILRNSRQPFPAALLNIASRSAPYVSAGRVPIGLLLENLERAILNLDRQTGQQVGALLTGLKAQLGVDLKTDLLDQLGDEYVQAVTATPTTAPLALLPGMVVAVQVRDGAKVGAVFKKLQERLEVLRRESPLLELLTLGTVQHEGQTIYHLKGYPLLGAPAACVWSDRLILGTSLNAIRRSLEQGKAADNILANPEFQQTLARLSGRPFQATALPPAFAYQVDQSSGNGVLLLSSLGMAGGIAALGGVSRITPHPPEEYQQAAAFSAFPILKELSQALGPVAARKVWEALQTIDLGAWPDEAFFVRHRQARGLVMDFEDGVVNARSDFPFPSPIQLDLLSSVAVTSMLAGMVLPVLSKARESARRTGSMSNLSQLGKALTLYASTPEHKGLFPEDAHELVPGFIADTRIFVCPRLGPGRAGYVYLSGSADVDGTNLLAYESSLDDPVSEGGNVLKVDGSVQWMRPAEFKVLLEETEKAIKQAGRVMKKVPLEPRGAGRQEKF